MGRAPHHLSPQVFSEHLLTLSRGTQRSQEDMSLREGRQGALRGLTGAAGVLSGAGPSEGGVDLS